MKKSSRQNAFSYLFLFITALLWGFAFAAQRLGGKALGSFSFNAIRFTVGSLSLVPLLFVFRGSASLPDGTDEKSPRTEDSRTKADARSLLFAGLVCGMVLFFGSSLQQVGLLWTEAGKAAFLTGLYIIFVPAAGLLAGKKQGWGLGFGAVLAAAGLYLMSVRSGFSISFGDSLEIASAFFWTAHILVLGYYSQKFNPIALACLQNLVCAVLSLGAALVSESFTLATVALAFSPGPEGSLVPVLYSGICSIGIAYTLQIFGQKGVSPGPASLIMSLEAVFAAVGGWFVLGETMDARALAGAALMLAGMVAAQVIPPSFSLRRLRSGPR